MNILILTDRYYPAPISGAILIRDLALELTSEGHQVFLACGDSTMDQKFLVEEEDNISVLRVKIPDPRDLSLPMRLFHEIRLQKKIWLAFSQTIVNQDLDMVIVHSPTIFWHFILKQLNKRHNLKIYLVLRDLFPQWILDTKLIGIYNPVYWYMKLREIQLYNQVSIIGVQSNSNLNYFKTKKYLQRFKVEILYNWKIVGEKSKLNSDIRKQLNLGNKVLFVFGGNLGFAQDIDNLLRLASSMKRHPNFHLLFIGEGTQFNKIKKWITEYRMENNMSLLPAVSNEKYQSILNECDVGVISLRKDFKTDNFPNKLLNYMEYKLPILASINLNNELSDFIKEKQIGLVCYNGDDKQLLENVKSLIESKNQRERMGEQAFELLKEKFDVKMAVKKIFKVSST